MLVYGDHVEQGHTVEIAHRLNARLEQVRSSAPGLQRHADLVGLLVNAGRLLQGVADAAFAEDQRDTQTRAVADVTAFLASLAEAVCRSWDSGFEDLALLQPLELRSGFPPAIELKLPEGFAFYAVYPEAYLEAARRLRLHGRPRVIGIRSIGTALAAVVAAQLGAEPPVTVRPFGDPFARRIALDPALERQLLDGGGHYVIVDEGPGLSGSSFAAVAGWLRERGVPDQRIAVMPSHAGQPGCAAPPERQRWWGEVQREVGTFDGRWTSLLRKWCADSLGWRDVFFHDVSAGAWRRCRFADEQDWPPAVPAWERRKFIAEVKGQRFLLKFAGIGEIGEAKMKLARTLQAERLIPQPIALVHGFLVEPWLAGARPLACDALPVAEVAQYIGARARLLPAPEQSGASVERLLDMACRNVALALGDVLAAAHRAKWEPRIAAIAQRVRRVHTDNKLDRCEWLRTPAGELIKTDALDHHQAHDLIGCQDVAWDAAGAVVEFEMSQRDRARLVAGIARNGGGVVHPDLLEFYLLAYPAFRLGQARLAATMTGNAEEKARLSRADQRYSARLRSIGQSSTQ